MAEVELPNPEETHEHASDGFTKFVALSTAVFAVLLAIASLLGSNCMKEMLLAQQKASNTFAFYQSKVNRERQAEIESAAIRRDMGDFLLRMEDRNAVVPEEWTAAAKSAEAAFASWRKPAVPEGASDDDVEKFFDAAREKAFKPFETIPAPSGKNTAGSLAWHQRLWKDLVRFEAERSRYNFEKKKILATARHFEEEVDVNQKKDPYFDYAEVLLQISIVMASVSMLSKSRLAYGVAIVLAVCGALLAANGHTLKFELLHKNAATSGSAEPPAGKH